MGSEIEWDNEEQTILRHTLTAPWSFDEITAAKFALHDTLRQNGVPIGVIVHLTEPLHIPTNSISSFHNLVNRQPDEIVITVFVLRETPMVRALYGIVERIAMQAGHTIQRTDNLTEARRIVHDYLNNFS